MLISLVQGQIQSESRPAFRAIGGRDAASMNTDESMPARFASLDSSLKEVASNFCIKARTTIFDDEFGQAIFCAKGKTDKGGSGQRRCPLPFTKGEANMDDRCEPYFT